MSDTKLKLNSGGLALTISALHEKEKYNVAKLPAVVHSIFAFFAQILLVDISYRKLLAYRKADAPAVTHGTYLWAGPTT